MAVYYKFASAKDYDSISLDGHFISVANLKEKIFEKKHLNRGTDFDLVVTNAQTNEEYLDEEMLIPKNTSVLLRRVPGHRRMPIVTAPVIVQDKLDLGNKSEDVQAASSRFPGADQSVSIYPDDSEWDEFGNDLYAIPEVLPAQSSNPVQDAPPPNRADEDNKIRALIDTPALDWQSQNSDGFGAVRGFGRGMGGRMGGRGFGRGVGMERKTPPEGYICHRCKVAGHFIQHCPTNGDPTFDIRRVKPPTGIPKSMLMATPDGSYALPSGAVAVLKPNEAAFEREIEGMPSTRSVGDLPPELHCPLCRKVMKDAVLTSKCCFKSFCDKCIRDHIISKSMCVCGATNVLADDILPNKTLRDTINRILESNNSSGENGGSVFQVQDMESARCPQPKIPSPTLSAASKGEQVPPQKLALPNEETATNNQNMTEPINVDNVPKKTLDKMRPAKVADVSEATHDSRSVKEPASQGSALVAEEELQQKPVSGEAGKKKKKKKARLPVVAAEMQWRASQDFPPENYVMPMGHYPFNPYWNGMQPGMDGFVGGPYGGPMPFMGYGPGPMPMEIPFGVFPQDPFGPPVNMMPFPPQRDLAEFGMGFNGGAPILSREDFEARKADIKHQRDIERRSSGRELSRDREFGREMSSSADGSLIKSKYNSITQPKRTDHRRYDRPRSERFSPERHSQEPEHPRTSSKRKSSDYEYEPEHPRTSSKRKSSEHDQYESEHPRTSTKRKSSEYDQYEPEHARTSSKRKSSEYEEPSHQHREREHHRHQRPESLLSSARPPVAPTTSEPLQRPPKSSTSSDRRKASVFSRICFPEGESAASKKRNIGSPPVGGSGHRSSSHEAVSNGFREDHNSKVAAVTVSKKSSSVEDYEYESSDDDRHFKRRPSRYEASPPAVEPSRGTREREGARSSKHREH